MSPKLIKTKFKNLYYHEKDGIKTYQALVRHNKVLHRRTFTQGLTEKQALNKLEDFKRELKSGKRQTRKNITLEALFHQYIDLIKPFQSEQTIKTKNGYFNKHISPRYGEHLINDLQYKHYQKLINDLLNVGLKPKTSKNIKDILQVMYNTAIHLGYTDHNPLMHVAIPKFDNTRYFEMSNEKIKSLYTTILTFEEPLYRAIFTFLLQGRRLNEVLSITWDELDMEKCSYVIPAVKNKARKSMTYDMDKYLYAMLQDHASRQKELNGLVFKSPKTGKKIQDVRRAWTRILKKAEIEKMRIHDIRHMIGTYSINELNLPIEKVSYALGHTNITTTQKYVNPRGSAAREVSEAMSNALMPQPQNIGVSHE